MSFAAECWPSLPSAMSQNPGQVQDSLKGFAHPSQKPAAYGGSNNPLNTSDGGVAERLFYRNSPPTNRSSPFETSVGGIPSLNPAPPLATNPSRRSKFNPQQMSNKQVFTNSEKTQGTSSSSTISSSTSLKSLSPNTTSLNPNSAPFHPFESNVNHPQWQQQNVCYPNPNFGNPLEPVPSTNYCQDKAGGLDVAFDPAMQQLGNFGPNLVVINQNGIDATTPRPCASLPVSAPTQPAVFQQFQPNHFPQDTPALGVPQTFNQISTVSETCVNSSPSPSQVATTTALPATWITPTGREQEMAETSQLPVDAVAATMQHYLNKIEGVKSVMDRSVLANLYLLAKDHNAQMKSKDKAIRRLEKEKEEAQTALALLRSEKESSPKVDIISVYQLAKQHDELTNKMADQVRQLQLEKADVETTLLNVRIEQERKARLEKSKGHHRHLTENQLAKVYRALECICCFDATSKKRIFQCQSGHLICEECHQVLSVKECPTCKTPYSGTTGHIRNLLAEELSHIFNE